MPFRSAIMTGAGMVLLLFLMGQESAFAIQLQGLLLETEDADHLKSSQEETGLQCLEWCYSSYVTWVHKCTWSSFSPFCSGCDMCQVGECSQNCYSEEHTSILWHSPTNGRGKCDWLHCKACDECHPGNKTIDAIAAVEGGVDMSASAPSKDNQNNKVSDCSEYCYEERHNGTAWRNLTGGDSRCDWWHCTGCKECPMVSQTVEMSEVDGCRSFCYERRHRKTAWRSSTGGESKCSWTNCQACKECQIEGQAVELPAAAEERTQLENQIVAAAAEDATQAENQTVELSAAAAERIQLENLTADLPAAPEEEAQVENQTVGLSAAAGENAQLKNQTEQLPTAPEEGAQVENQTVGLSPAAEEKTTITGEVPTSTGARNDESQQAVAVLAPEDQSSSSEEQEELEGQMDLKTRPADDMTETTELRDEEAEEASECSTNCYSEEHAELAWHNGTTGRGKCAWVHCKGCLECLPSSPLTEVVATLAREDQGSNSEGQQELEGQVIMKTSSVDDMTATEELRDEKAEEAFECNTNCYSEDHAQKAWHNDTAGRGKCAWVHCKGCPECLLSSPPAEVVAVLAPEDQGKQELEGQMFLKRTPGDDITATNELRDEKAEEVRVCDSFCYEQQYASRSWYNMTTGGGKCRWKRCKDCHECQLARSLGFLATVSKTDTKAGEMQASEAVKTNEAEEVDECSAFCYEKQHQQTAWRSSTGEGPKCDWLHCKSCKECQVANQTVEFSAVAEAKPTTDEAPASTSTRKNATEEVGECSAFCYEKQHQVTAWRSLTGEESKCDWLHCKECKECQLTSQTVKLSVVAEAKAMTAGATPASATASENATNQVGRCNIFCYGQQHRETAWRNLTGGEGKCDWRRCNGCPECLVVDQTVRLSTAAEGNTTTVEMPASAAASESGTREVGECSTFCYEEQHEDKAWRSLAGEESRCDWLHCKGCKECQTVNQTAKSAASAENKTTAAEELPASVATSSNETEQVGECSTFCYEEQHEDKAWRSFTEEESRCDWLHCKGCKECQTANQKAALAAAEELPASATSSKNETEKVGECSSFCYEEQHEDKAWHSLTEEESRCDWLHCKACKECQTANQTAALAATVEGKTTAAEELPASATSSDNETEKVANCSSDCYSEAHALLPWHNEPGIKSRGRCAWMYCKGCQECYATPALAVLPAPAEQTMEASMFLSRTPANHILAIPKGTDEGAEQVGQCKASCFHQEQSAWNRYEPPDVAKCSQIECKACRQCLLAQPKLSVAGSLAAEDQYSIAREVSLNAEISALRAKADSALEEQSSGRMATPMPTESIASKLPGYAIVHRMHEAPAEQREIETEVDECSDWCYAEEQVVKIDWRRGTTVVGKCERQQCRGCKECQFTSQPTEVTSVY